MEAWLEISKPEAVAAVRRRATEVGRSSLHVLDRRLVGECRSTYAIEQFIRSAELVSWAAFAPYDHELVIVETFDDARAYYYGFLFVDVQQFLHTQNDTGYDGRDLTIANEHARSRCCCWRSTPWRRLVAVRRKVRS